MYYTHCCTIIFIHRPFLKILCIYYAQHQHSYFVRMMKMYATIFSPFALSFSHSICFIFHNSLHLYCTIYIINLNRYDFFFPGREKSNACNQYLVEIGKCCKWNNTFWNGFFMLYFFVIGMEWHELKMEHIRIWWRQRSADTTSSNLEARRTDVQQCRRRIRRNVSDECGGT